MAGPNFSYTGWHLTFDDEFNSLQLYNFSTGTGHWQATFGFDPHNANNYSLLGNGELVQLYGAPGQARFDFMWPMISENAIGAVILADNRRSDTIALTLDYVREFASRPARTPPRRPAGPPSQSPGGAYRSRCCCRTPAAPGAWSPHPSC